MEHTIYAELHSRAALLPRLDRHRRRRRRNLSDIFFHFLKSIQERDEVSMLSNSAPNGTNTATGKKFSRNVLFLFFNFHSSSKFKREKIMTIISCIESCELSMNCHIPHDIYYSHLWLYGSLVK